ncbi:MAG: arginase family protein, partial [Clostridia bacterium]|nr:arginase family protein [Clostridia bacterium]
LDVGNNKVNLYGKNTYIIGAHSIDRGEYPIIEEQGVHLYTADEVRRRGYKEVVDEVLAATKGMKIHLSFDVDSIRGSDFPATGYALEGGLTYKTVYSILKKIIGEADISSLDIVEYNPHIDEDGKCLEKMLEIFSLLI